MIDSDLLGAFCAFSETLNFTHAARRVGLSQPALFERIQRLQELLEVALYRKVGRSLELTEPGERVAAHAREMQERSRVFQQELRGQPEPQWVTLAAGEGGFLYLLGEALRRFTAEGPAKLRLLTLGARDACAAVRSGEAQLAVCVLDLVPAQLIAEDLLRTPLCIALPPGHRLARRRSLTLRALAEERFIVTPQGQLHRELVGRALGRVGFEVKDPVEADGWPLMLRFVELGLGVAIVNGVCQLPAGVVALPLPELGSVTYRLVRRRGARLPAAAERLAALIRGT